jgi:glycerophosphoryl diester phosphodiesterase
MSELLRNAFTTLRRRWRDLVLADLFFKAIGFGVLTPLAVAVVQGVLWLTGSRVLADADILVACLTPAGALGAVVIAAVWLGITALEVATLLAMLTQAPGGGLAQAVWLVWSRSAAIFRLAGQLVVTAILVAVPFVLMAAGAAWRLLGEADINYYLSERPPAFQVALVVAACLGLGLTAVILRIFAGWLLAVPLVLCGRLQPREAMRESRRKLRGRERQAFGLLAGWAALVFLLTGLASGVVVAVARELLPLVSGNLPVLIAAVGATLLAWTLVHLVVNLLAVTSFAVLLDAAARAVLPANELSVSQPVAAGPPVWSGLRSRRGLVLVAGIGCLVAIVSGGVAVRRVSLSDSVEVMGHRGAAGLAPENTLAAVEAAIAAGADWIEIDVQESADGEVIVIHDSDFMKLAGVATKVWKATRDDLATIDVGSRFGPAYAGERVPTLREVLTRCRGRIGVNIELKSYGHGQRLEQRVVEIVEAHGDPADVLLMSLKPAVVRKVKALRPAWRAGLLLSVAVGDIAGLEADFLAVNARFVSRPFVQQAHQAGKEVFAWTVNDPAAVSRMIGRGVDGVITDRPDIARQVLTDRAGYSPVERLLVEVAEFLGVPTVSTGQ